MIVTGSGGCGSTSRNPAREGRIVGGVALLLWGIRMVRTGITRSFGATLRQALAAGTRTGFPRSLQESRSPGSCRAARRPP